MQLDVANKLQYVEVVPEEYANMPVKQYNYF
jgi:hypothetical protein